jgi:hypothetical protein
MEETGRCKGFNASGVESEIGSNFSLLDLFGSGYAGLGRTDAY